VVVAVINIDAISVWATPFADAWAPFWRDATRIGASLALLIALVLLGLATFTALTLAVGDPFYERIWLAVEAREGGFARADDMGFWASIGRGIVSGLRLLLPSIGVGLLLFAVGLVPVVGGLTAILLGAVLGGRLLARELLARPFDGRGIDEAGQSSLRRAHRARLTGFGAMGYLLFLVPFGAVFAMPAAVAGSTLLARDLLGEPPCPSTGGELRREPAR
jgi:CysZ protein